MDANAHVLDKNQQLATWLSTLGLIDIHTHHHGTENDPPTHIRGSKRIDYVFCSLSLIPYIQHSGILPFGHFLPSDHRALYIDIHITQYLQGQPSSLHSPEPRSITSANPKAIHKYCTILQKWLDSTKFETELHALTTLLNNNPTDMHVQDQLNDMDRRLLSIRLQAERQSKLHTQHPWSPRFRTAHQTVQYWKLWLREFRSGINYTSQRQHLQHTSNTVTTRPSLTEIQKHLREAQRHLR